MNQFKGTKGSWKVIINDDNTPDIVSDSGVEIAYTPNYNGDKTEQLANARLIAAAPELLKVLQLAIAKRNSEYELYMKMKAIVAKAIGE